MHLLGQSTTDHNWVLLQVEGLNTMTVRGLVTKPFMVMVIQITHKQVQGAHPQPARQPLI